MAGFRLLKWGGWPFLQEEPGITVTKHPTFDLYYVEEFGHRGYIRQTFTTYGRANRAYKKFLKENGGRNDL